MLQMYSLHPALCKFTQPRTIRNNVCEPSDLRVPATYTTALAVMCEGRGKCRLEYDGVSTFL
jgi:hypothetical protein